MQEEIIREVERDLLIRELTRDKFLRTTNYGNNEIYIVTHHDSPNTMLEIGRLREVSFRAAGGGTGKSADIDKFDTASIPYKQLIVWDPNEQEIVGGYRFILGNEVEVDEKGKPMLATSGLLDYSSKFINDYLPVTIELGRSFVQPKYQPSKESRKGLFSLDNLWDGLGALVIDYPQTEYFFGKVTMYTHFNPVARDLILFFLHKFFPDNEKLTWPKEPLPYKTDTSGFDEVFTGDTFEQNHKILFQKVRELGENIPPLVNSYMSLSATMKTFGTAINEEFGGVEETGILIRISDIYENKKDRHINTYAKGC